MRDGDIRSLKAVLEDPAKMSVLTQQDLDYALFSTAGSITPGKAALDLIPLLINAGADANHIYALDPIYCTPLTIAIDRGNIAMSRALIEAGADVNYTTDFRGDGALVIVSRYGT